VHGARYTKKDKELIQHRFTNMINYRKCKTYEDRLRFLGLWTFEERRNGQDLIELFKISKD